MTAKGAQEVRAGRTVAAMCARCAAILPRAGYEGRFASVLHSSSRVHPRFFGGGGSRAGPADPAHRTGEFCRREQHARPARPAEPCRAGQRPAKGRHHPAAEPPRRRAAAEPRCPEAHRAAGPADQRTLDAAAERIHASQASEEVERHLALHPRPQLLARELAPEAGLPPRLQPFLDVLDHVRRRRAPEPRQHRLRHRVPVPDRPRRLGVGDRGAPGERRGAWALRGGRAPCPAGGGSPGAVRGAAH